MIKKIYKWHKWLSIFIFIPIVLISLSGSILVYKQELKNIFMPSIMNIKESGSFSFDKSIEKINSVYPEYEVAGWLLPKEENKSHSVYLIKHNTHEWDVIYFNPYSKEILDELRAHDSSFLDWLVEFHSSFAIEEPGLVILGIVGLILLIIAISGIIISRKFWKNLFRIRFDKNKSIYFSDLHKTLGIITSPILLIIVITGTYWCISYSIMELKEHEHFDIKSNMYNKEIVSVDNILQKAENSIENFTVNYIAFPTEPDNHFRFFGEIKDQNILFNEYSNIVTIDEKNLEILSVYNITNESFLSKFLDTFRKAHYGDYNQITKFIWFLIGLTPLILSFTGIYLYLKRRK
jgi:uncharacterized iron-regulated membrane protein